MERLNFQHLYYFWTVATEGSVSKASEKLHLAQPTISGQLAVFEQAIGERLFSRERRKLILTDTGRSVLHYAEEIFALGQELTNTLKGRGGGRGLRLSIGVADALPKLVAYRLIRPAMTLPEPVQVLCYEDKADRLLAEIALHSIDLVLSDVPATPAAGARIFNHLLGECGVGVFGIPRLADQYSRDFPRSLSAAPLLLPTPATALRRSLNQWFDSHALSPKIQAEIEDSALLKTFGAAGAGLFFAPTVLETQVREQYGVRLIGRIDEIRERFYAISSRRKQMHPGITAILDNASNALPDNPSTPTDLS